MQQQSDIALGRILSLLRQEYQQLDGFMNATLEMDRLADGEDPGAFGVYLDMRANYIKRIDQLKAQRVQELATLPNELAYGVKTALQKQDPAAPLPEAVACIREAGLQNRALHARIVAADSRLNAKVGNIAPEAPAQPAQGAIK